jgi:hypothetical protein
LNYLNCGNNAQIGNNNITTLDLSKNTSLEILYCEKINLISLNITNTNALRQVQCEHNRIASLDILNLHDLELLRCAGNLLDSLDVSKNLSLGGVSGIRCHLDISEMPGLQKVCVSIIPFPPQGLLLCTDGSPNVYFTTDCIK